MKNQKVWKAFDGIVKQLEPCLASPKKASKIEASSTKSVPPQKNEKSAKKIGKKVKTIKR
jgi:hypothetical protein